MYASFSSQQAEIFTTILAAVPDDLPIYLVGGALRDVLSGRPAHDLDFVMPHSALQVGRRVAGRLGSVFYPLDEKRETARVITKLADDRRLILDFATYRGPDLHADLVGRDFTINAMAFDLRTPGILVDPLGGLEDLRQKVLRPCSAKSFQDDPLRVLRAIRLATQFEYRIVPESLSALRANAPGLAHVSAERIRDETLRILANPNPAVAMRLMESAGALLLVFPELAKLKGVSQSSPHTQDVWEHTLSVLQRLESLMAVLGFSHDEDARANLLMGLVSMRLGRYRQALNSHLQREHLAGSPEHGLRPLLFWAALYHDAGKPETYSRIDGGQIHFYGHEQVSEQRVIERAVALRLSVDEIDRISCVVRHHMRIHHLVNAAKDPSQRAIYRYFRDTGAAGIDIALLSIADLLATYGVTIPLILWDRHIEIVRKLFDAWWDKPAERVRPPRLVTGSDLLQVFRLQPGPVIGQALEAVQEAQACGEVQTKEQALDFVKRWLDGERPQEN